MGFWFYLARRAGEIPPDRAALIARILREPMFERRPDDEDRPVEPDTEFLADCGFFDVNDKPPSDGSFVAPWLSVRFSWAVDVEEDNVAKTLDALARLAQDQDLMLFVGDDPVTMDDLLAELARGQKAVLGLFGRVRPAPDAPDEPDEPDESGSDH